MARDVHDLAVALGAHRAGHGLDAVEGARDVGVHHLLPGLGGEPPERAVVRHARVVHQEVDATQALPHRGDELLHVVAFAYVAPCAIHRHAERAEGGLGEESLCRHVAVGQVDVVDRDRRAVLGVLARSRGETVNAAWLLTAAVCTYAVGYRFYSKFLASRVFGLDDRRATPAERFNNGRDFVPTNKWVLFGHHFAAIAGAGPLVGPVLAAQFGFLPGTLWLVIGVVLGGAVQAFGILF